MAPMEVSKLVLSNILATEKEDFLVLFKTDFCLRSLQSFVTFENLRFLKVLLGGKLFLEVGVY